MSSSTDLLKPKPHERTRAMRRQLLRQALAANAAPGEESTERVSLSKKQRRKLQHTRIIDSKQAKLQVRNYSSLMWFLQEFINLCHINLALATVRIASCSPATG